MVWSIKAVKATAKTSVKLWRSALVNGWFLMADQALKKTGENMLWYHMAKSKTLGLTNFKLYYNQVHRKDN